MNLFKFILNLFKSDTYDFVQFDRFPESGEVFWKKDYKGNWDSFLCINVESQDQSIIYVRGKAWSVCLLHQCYKKLKK